MKNTLFRSNKDETVRMFESDALEALTHIHPATPIVVFSPVVMYCAYRAVSQEGAFVSAGVFIAGLLLWTLTEYFIHRVVFHYHPKSRIGKKLHFMTHGVHHDYPRDSSRLVMPLIISVPLATAFFFAFAAIAAPHHFALFAGFILGYVAYDTIHYFTHHLPMRGRIGNFLKQYHMKHHFVDGDSSYGVSNPLWDHVFRTLPPIKR